MLITRLKPIDEILPLIGDKICVICCRGCREVYYPGSDVKAMLDNPAVSGTVLEVITMYNACNIENIKLLPDSHADTVSRADTVLVVSCGVGVQTVSEYFRSNDYDAVTRPAVLAACDTYPLPGRAGLSPAQYDCALCGECHLNETGGICPVTACSKGLINGECGGAKGGMCEVDPDVKCGWERIYERVRGRDTYEAYRTV